MMTYDDELNAINSHRLAAQTRASERDRKFAPLYTCPTPRSTISDTASGFYPGNHSMMVQGIIFW